MLTRREFLIKSGLIAAGTQILPRVFGETSAEHWPPYRRTLAVDGQGGSAVFFLQENDPALPAELQAIRDSGLTGLIVSPAPQGRFWLNDAAFERSRQAMAAWKSRIEAHGDLLLHVQTAADLERARTEDRLGLIFAFQGTEPLGEEIGRISMFREMGLRVMQLTHNRRNLVGDGCMEPGNAGLSNYGRQVVERLNAEKLVIDLSHASPRTTREAIQASAAPVLIGHTGCRALADLPRNVDDAELRALADKGGVAGIIFWPYLRVDRQPMAIDVIRHLEHAINVCGEDHVGIGTDGGVAPVKRSPEWERENREWVRASKQEGIFAAKRPDDLYPFIPDLNVANRFELVAARLSKRGHSDERIQKLLGRNFARVMREVWGG
ncbi:MAG TPA: membrane dipeptidase [Chthoniobacterales bacterium]|nr:membrane dipeptidase [Chthoniobacterales bacterium]